MDELASTKGAAMINRISRYLRQPGSADTSLMTILGVISGEILTQVEQQGQSTLRQLIRDLPWPAPLVTMAVGSLIREGLIKASQLELEVLIEPKREWVPKQAEDSAEAPEVWGG